MPDRVDGHNPRGRCPDIIGTGFAIDESGNYLVDGSGNRLVLWNGSMSDVVLNAAALEAILGFKPVTNLFYKQVATGTPYTLTDTLSNVVFGTASPVITITQPGSYLVFGRVQYQFSGATFLANRTLTHALGRLNNTPAQLATSDGNAITGITNLITADFGAYTVFTEYTTNNSDDQIGLMARVSAVPTAGNMLVTNAGLYALRLQK